MSIRKDKTASTQPTWILDYLDENGIRRRNRVHCSMAVAKSKYRMILSEIEKRRLGLTEGNQYILLKDLIMRYLVNSEIDGKSPLTIRRIKNATDAFKRILGEEIPVGEITREMIENFKKTRLTDKTPRNTLLTKAGLNSDMRHDKAMFNWAVNMGIISRSPFSGVKFINTENKPIRFLTIDELKSLYRAIEEAEDISASDLVTFYVQTGARCSEILPPKFTWKNVDLDRNLITLIGKRKRRRSLPLNALTKDILQKRSSLPHPFDYSPSQVSRILKKYYNLSHIQNASVHTLRKTCGSLLIQNGMDIYRVSRWLGHSTVEVTTRHYVDLLKSEYEDISDNLHRSASAYLP